MSDFADVAVIGGGFYGAAIANYFAERASGSSAILFEREDSLMSRASYNNQARIHNGYHYPRSFTTAFRSRFNLPRFVKDWPGVVKKDFTKLYAIARRNSKVTAKQFERFCRDIGAELHIADAKYQALFESRLIEQVYEAQEYAFDTTKLAEWAIQQIAKNSVDVRYRNTVDNVTLASSGELILKTVNEDGFEKEVRCKKVFNCTYSGLNQIKGCFSGTKTKLKHEITEMALIKPPKLLDRIGITVMDGPFFSLMPFPARSLYTLSHVRYTPHLQWIDCKNINPYEKLENYHKQSRCDRMLRDVSRYIPDIAGAEHMDSLFEIKTVLMKNEGDDGRPILFEKYEKLPGFFSVLGGKIDNIFDVFEMLDKEIH